MKTLLLLLRMISIAVLAAASAAAYDVPWDTLNNSVQVDVGQANVTPGGNTPGSCGSPLQVASGNFIQAVPLLAIPGRGPSLNIALTYHSFDQRRGPFGVGWTSSYDQRVIETTDGVSVTTVCAGPEGWRETYTLSADGSYTPPPYVHTALSKNSDGSFVLRDKNGMVRNFDATGHMVSVVDRNGNILALAYDPTGFLTTVTDSAGRTVTLTKGGDGRVAILTDPANRQFKFQYDANGDLTQIADPLGNQTTLQYDSTGHLTSLSDPQGNTLLQASYNSDGTLASYVRRAEKWTITYDPSNQKTTETDSNYNSWAHYYNSSGSITKTVDPLQNAEVTVYDANSNSIQYTDKNNHTTVTTFDSNANRLTIQDAIGNTVTFTYDPVYNFPLTVKDRLGGLTTFTYDSKGNLTKVADALGNATQYQYDSKGQLVGIIDALGNSSSLAYDTYGNVLTWTDPLGHKRTSTYDILGSVTSTTDANGKTTQLSYDSDRRLTKSVDPLGQSAVYQYDASGNLTSITIPSGATTSFQYDNLDRLTLTTNPLGNKTQYAYDAKDNLTNKTDANGNSISYNYDALSRLTSKWGSDFVTYAYDAVGNLVQLGNNGATLSYTYDADNRLLQAKTASSSYQPSTTITYAYDANGRRTTMTDPSGGVTKYTYDAVSHLVSLQDPAGNPFNFAYDKASRRTGMTGPAGISNSYSWDGANRLTGLTEQASAGSLAFAYVYDPVANVLSRTDAAGNHSYGYDPLYRLVSATHPSGQPAESYVYDSVGNRTASSLSATYSYDAANRLLADATFNYTFDARGNLTKKTLRSTGASTSYSYDSEARLTSIGDPQYNYSYYNYDGLGRRIAKSTGNTTTQYVYDGPNIIAEYNGSGSLVASYTHGPGVDEVLSVNRGGVSSYFQRDGLGSIVQTVSSSGITSSYKYDSYGHILSQTGTPQGPYAFTGREYDAESGLYYYRARYYSPDLGRFMSEDPIGFSGGPNFYSYVDNDPASHTDPQGEFVVPLLVAVPVVGGVIQGTFDAINAQPGDKGWAFARGFGAGFIGTASGLITLAETGNPLLGYGVSGFVSNYLDQALTKGPGNLNMGNVAESTVLSVVLGGFADFAMPSISGPNPNIYLLRELEDYGPKSIRMLGSEGLSDALQAAGQWLSGLLSSSCPAH